MKNLEGKEISRDTILSAMRQNIDDCVDPATGEVNTTRLAENAANAFDLYEDNVHYVIPEEVFELAIDANDKYG